MSIWWLVVPTLIYLFLTHNVLNTVVLAAIAVGLHVALTRPEVPVSAKPYVPLLQTVAVFVFFGGNIVVLGIVVAAGAAVYSQRDALFRALEPWWQIQQRMSPTTRRVIAVIASLIVGYWFGGQASGNEWTYTFLSMVIATIITFLLVFTPPSHSTSGGLT